MSSLLLSNFPVEDTQRVGTPQPRLAILIDADNADPAIIEGLLNEIAKYGVASIKRIYGDWTDNRLRSWKTHLLNHGINPIQQFAYTTGKNATDSAMIIDTMDLLYSEKLDGFCIVSSDSDFTRLASRLRESGRVVYGFGKKQTPRPFVVACDKFIYTDILYVSQGGDEDKKTNPDVADTNPPAKSKGDFKKDKKLLKLLRDSVDDVADESGWACLGPVGTNINNRLSDFDPRHYGFKKLSDMFRAISQFEIENVPSNNGSGKRLCVRWKNKQQTLNDSQ